MPDIERALRVANLAIEELAEDNVRLGETLASLQISHDVYRQMVSVALTMLWQQNAMQDAAGATRDRH